MEKTKLSKLATKLLLFFLKERLAEEVLRDLEEKFYKASSSSENPVSAFKNDE